jgi:hypothetical protein
MKIMAKIIPLLPLAAAVAAAPPARRVHPENELIAHPAIRITVGQRDADLIGRDHRALQAAVDYVARLGGGVVEIGPGVYVMRDSLHLRTGVTVRGAGAKTILKKAPSARSPLAADGDFGEPAITVAEPDKFHLGDGVYIATKRVHGFHAICATILNRRGNYLTLSRPLNADCMMRDAAFAATVFPVISAYHARDFRVENLTIEGNREANEEINGCRGAGIFFYQGDGGVIKNCTVRGYNGDGISFQQSHDVQVLDCLVEHCAGGGIHPGSGSQRCVVRGCRSLRNDRDGFFFCWRVRHGVVEDNVFRGNGGVGISIGHKDSDNLIRRNLIADNAGGGVYWRNEARPQAAHRITFTHNRVENNGRFGLFIDGETDGTILRDNTIRCADPEAVALHLGPRVGEVTLENNTLVAARRMLDERQR